MGRMHGSEQQPLEGQGLLAAGQTEWETGDTRPAAERLWEEAQCDRILAAGSHSEKNKCFEPLSNKPGRLSRRATGSTCHYDVIGFDPMEP